MTAQHAPCPACGRPVVLNEGETSPGIHAPEGEDWSSSPALPGLICSGSVMTEELRAAIEASRHWEFTQASHR
jgi:hypothetical protein